MNARGRRTRPRRWLEEDVSVGAAARAPAIRSATCSPMRGLYAAAPDDRSPSPRSLITLAGRSLPRSRSRSRPRARPGRWCRFLSVLRASVPPWLLFAVGFGLEDEQPTPGITPGVRCQARFPAQVAQQHLAV